VSSFFIVLLCLNRPADLALYRFLSDSKAERDVFNEKPTREEATIASVSATTANKGSQLSKIAPSATLHTTLGDIQLELYPDVAPKAVENFVGHARSTYYEGVLFHRVIKKFMIQTGDPLGDGTGGESVWGKNFEDEFSKNVKHDRPYMLSMANAGPKTNGSQFFITTVPAPWLDNKHTCVASTPIMLAGTALNSVFCSIFGRATAGYEVVHQIENVRVDKTDKPHNDIKIVSVSIH
jgi:peptidylprolyl isomerase domain and WD repeat-containing protein 1